MSLPVSRAEAEEMETTTTNTTETNIGAGEPWKASHFAQLMEIRQFVRKSLEDIHGVEVSRPCRRTTASKDLLGWGFLNKLIEDNLSS